MKAALFLVLVAACGDSDHNDTTTPDAKVTPTPDAPVVVTPDAATQQTCTAARAQLLGSVDTVSTGVVTQLDTTRIYVDSSAGGASNAATNPWIYINLETRTKASVTDVTAATSTAWDLALKRPVIYTNSGDAGPGAGGAQQIDTAFASATAADGTAIAPEDMFDADCNANTDPTGAALTTFSTWYDYDPNTHLLSPHAGSFIVRGATGKKYKLAIETYYAQPDGSAGSTSGAYTIDVTAL